MLALFFHVPPKKCFSMTQYKILFVDTRHYTRNDFIHKHVAKLLAYL